MKGTIETARLLTEIFVGTRLISGIHRFIGAVEDAATANSSEFASSTKKVRESIQDLLTPSSGLPAATKAMEDLSYKLKDPALIDAADRVTSTVLVAWTKMKGFLADAVIGWDHIMAGPHSDKDKLRDQITDLYAQRNAIMASMAGGAGIPAAGSMGDKMLEARRQKLEQITQQLIALQVQYTNAAPDLEQFRVTAEAILNPVVVTAKKRNVTPEWFADYKKNLESADSLTQTRTEKVLVEWQKFDDSLAYLLKNGAITPKRPRRARRNTARPCWRPSRSLPTTW